MTIRRCSALALLATVSALVGCGGGPQLAEVEGVLKLNGKPLDKIQVQFWPEAGAPRSSATTNAEGRFVLKTDDGQRTGALVGWHKVVLKDVGVLGDKFLGRAGETVDMAKGKKAQISNAYSDPNKTTVRKEVTAGKCVIEIDLTTP
ncbi:hypothetical protein R5W24_002958 [Gemmata sp. JC717]|uniref:hypothetical protein n=1 Tax=Gemmata algarum TaxID=2975278 RepID=UPI0021BAD2F9|nr:hypothetical protein [Gemmata algarum]MDY3553844.1 hypothetical protein [Gemmata algarum]